jgi:glutamate carboxypeptidase
VTSAFDEAALVADIRTLVECESPSRDRAALARSARVVATLGERLLGAAPEVLETGDATHLRWRFGSVPSVLLLAHHDTVWPLGTLAERPFAVAAGIMTGPGCFDMKAGLVMALHAVAALGDRDGVTLLVTGDEELGSPGSRTLIEAEASGIRAALVLEASADGGDFKTERKGVSLYTVVVQGRAAHAGLEPHVGVNATVELAHQIGILANLGDPDAGTTVTPTLASSGTTTNTVPAQARVAVDVRVRSIAEQERVDSALRTLSPGIPDAVITVTGGPNRPPLERSSSAELAAHTRAIARRLGQAEPEDAAVGGASDGNFTAGLGIPTLDGLGAVGGGAHAEDEHVVVAQLAPRTLLVHQLLVELLEERG